MKELNNDTSRCNAQINGLGSLCHLRFNCLRFLQLQKDSNNQRISVISPNPFDKECKLMIKNENS